MSDFDYFVVLAGMRTGSNLLEEQLSAMPGLWSHGELFNPHFFGKPKQTEAFGFTMDERDADPMQVLAALRTDSDGLPGFRLFNDHDPRVIDAVLDDPKAAKIVLTRRPVESFVSLKIARKTGQWWLGDLASARSEQVTFDAREYLEFLDELTRFQEHVRRRLQVTGQTAFHIDYADLSNAEVILGLGRYLGAGGPPDTGKVRAKVQNPRPLADRLTNAPEAEAALNALNLPDLGYLPSHESERGPGFRLFHMGRSVPLLYMPIRGAGEDAVPDWLRSVDSKGVESGLSQKDVRRWMRQNPGHRGFTVLRHPLARVYDAFCQCILPIGLENYADIRDVLIRRYGVDLPNGEDRRSWTLERHREAFLGFLKFLSGNLGGQTSVRVDQTWASQSAFLMAIARFVVPDRVIREATIERDLRDLAGSVGLRNVPWPDRRTVSSSPYSLAEVQTPEIDAACASAYRRDYILFGFETWRPGQAA